MKNDLGDGFLSDESKRLITLALENTVHRLQMHGKLLNKNHELSRVILKVQFTLCTASFGRKELLKSCHLLF